MTYKKCRFLAAGFLLLCGFSGIVHAAEETAATTETAKSAPASPKWYDTVNANGFVDAYYSYNANGWHGPGDNKLHNFDFDSNELAVSMVELNFVKPAEKDKVGFYLGLAFGPAVDWIACASLTRTCAESPYKNLRQAYATVMLLPNMQFDFGKFVTQHGAEVIESQSNWNYTRSLLFSWAIPYYHSGARLTYTINDSLYVMGSVTNGWNNVSETNGGKTYGFQVGITPVKSLPIVLNYMTGPEVVSGTAGTPGATSDTKTLFDSLVTFNVTDSFSLMANYDNGAQSQGLGAGKDAHWSGWALYVRYALTPTIAAAVRYEQFNDSDGFTTGTAQKVSEETVTLEYAIAAGSLIRLDLRHDQTDASGVFTKTDGSATNSQDTATLGMVFTF